jgi:uncharacterized protein YjbI with pentapeptide repeats
MLKPPPDIQAILTVIGRRARMWEQGEEELIDLHAVQLQGVHLERAHLEGAFLIEANLKCSYLQEVYCEGARLEKANLQGADLGGAHLNNAHLQEARFEGGYLAGANLQGAHLHGAHFEGANLQTAKGLTQAQINAACLDEKTLLPAGLTLSSGLTRHPACTPAHDINTLFTDAELIDCPGYTLSR